MHEKLCCLIPVFGPTKEIDILDIFTKHFEERGIDMQTIFAATTNGIYILLAPSGYDR